MCVCVCVCVCVSVYDVTVTVYHVPGGDVCVGSPSCNLPIELLKFL